VQDALLKEILLLCTAPLTEKDNGAVQMFDF
jgi:hypothetical protein